jgi:hypothetical protein
LTSATRLWAIGAPVFLYDCNGSIAHPVRIISRWGTSMAIFDGNGTADVILWNGQFNYAPGGRNPVARLSHQVMR